MAKALRETNGYGYGYRVWVVTQRGSLEPASRVMSKRGAEGVKLLLAAQGKSAYVGNSEGRAV